MMAVISTRESLKMLGLLPENGARKAMYQAALDNLELSVIDFQTIRDILEISHIKDEPQLTEMAMISLFAARGEGSLCVRMDADTLRRRLPEFIGRDDMIDQFLAKLNAGSYDGMLVGHDETVYKPLILLNGNLYFQRYLRDECILRDSLREWLRESAEHAAPKIAMDDIRAAIKDVLDKPSRDAANGSINLNPEQQTALALSLLQSFTVITGGPGTGKTSIIMAILRCLVRMGVPVDRIMLTAPTGRAAKRMSESMQSQLKSLPSCTPEEGKITELSGQTIHRLLGYSPSRNSFTYNRENQLALDVVVVDEVSMIDTALMSRLLEAVPHTAKLILLGDSEQLPSVDAGTVLADLVPANTVPDFSAAMADKLKYILPTAADMPVAAAPVLLTDRVVRLRQSHRSNNEILAVAAVVNNFTADREAELFSLLTVAGSPCKWEDSTDEKSAAWWRRLGEWGDKYYGTGKYAELIKRCKVPDNAAIPGDGEIDEIMQCLTAAKILTVIHNSRYGCDNINAYIAESVRRQSDPGSRGRYFAGMPVMVTKNDYTLELFNGDTGVVLHDTAGGYRAAFPRGEEILLIPLDMLPEHTLAYAITVHKSQGSEYDTVMLVLPAADTARTNRLLTREIIYTAITRAKKTIILHTPRPTLSKSCIAKTERNSGGI